MHLKPRKDSTRARWLNDVACVVAGFVCAKFERGASTRAAKLVVTAYAAHGGSAAKT